MDEKRVEVRARLLGTMDCSSTIERFVEAALRAGRSGDGAAQEAMNALRALAREELEREEESRG